MPGRAFREEKAYRMHCGHRTRRAISLWRRQEQEIASCTYQVRRSISTSHSGQRFCEEGKNKKPLSARIKSDAAFQHLTHELTVFRANRLKRTEVSNAHQRHTEHLFVHTHQSTLLCRSICAVGSDAKRRRAQEEHLRSVGSWYRCVRMKRTDHQSPSREKEAGQRLVNAESDICEYSRYLLWRLNPYLVNPFSTYRYRGAQGFNRHTKYRIFWEYLQYLPRVLCASAVTIKALCPSVPFCALVDFAAM